MTLVHIGFNLSGRNLFSLRLLWHHRVKISIRAQIEIRKSRFGIPGFELSVCMFTSCMCDSSSFHRPDVQVRLSSYSKLPDDVNVSWQSCLSLFFSLG